MVILLAVLLSATPAPEPRACVTCAAPGCALPFGLPPCPDAPALAVSQPLQRRCDAGDGAACTKLAAMQAGQDISSAVVTLTAACDRGIARACLEAGLLDLEDAARGGAKRVSAAALFATGCDGGVPEACSQLAVQLRAGVPMPDGRGAACPAARNLST